MRDERPWRWYVGVLLGADSIAFGLALLGASVARDSLDPPTPVSANFAQYTLVAAAIVPGLLLILLLEGAYDRRHLLGGTTEYAHVATAFSHLMLVVIAASYFYGSTPLVSRTWLLLVSLLGVSLLLGTRFGLRRLACAQRKRGWFVRRLLIGGASDQGLAIAQQLHDPLRHGTRVVGLLDDYMPSGSVLPARGYIAAEGNGHAVDQFVVLGHPSEAREVAAQYTCDLLVVVPSALGWESQQQLAWVGETPGPGPEVRFAPTLYDVSAAGVLPAPLGYVPLLSLQPARINGVDAVLRAVVDTVVGALVLVLLAPVLAYAVARARWRGVKPIWIHRCVIGQGGRRVCFTLLSKNVTERLLVRGLPALVSVLRGELALAGPRPAPADGNLQHLQWASVLTAVRPGLTGPWRLTTSDEAASVERTLLADIWWVRNWSIWQHLFVLFQTARIAYSRSATRKVTRWGDGIIEGLLIYSRDTPHS